jgi:hypothetical protein
LKVGKLKVESSQERFENQEFEPVFQPATFTPLTRLAPTIQNPKSKI